MSILACKHNLTYLLSTQKQAAEKNKKATNPARTSNLPIGCL